MNRILATLALVIASSSAFAGPTCNVPKDKWMAEADFKVCAVRESASHWADWRACRASAS